MNCSGFTCRLHDTVKWYSFAQTYPSNWPVRTLVTNGREILTFLKGHWTEYIPSIGISLILYINPWGVTTIPTCLLSDAVFSLCSISSLGLEPIQCLPVILICSLSWSTEFYVLISTPNTTVSVTDLCLYEGHLTLVWPVDNSPPFNTSTSFIAVDIVQYCFTRWL